MKLSDWQLLNSNFEHYFLKGRPNLDGEYLPTQLQLQQDGTQSQRKGSQEGRQGPEEALWRQEEEKEEEGNLLLVHLQGAEAGPPRHWNLKQSYVDHELVRERYL